MTRMKRFFALLMAMVLTLSMSVPAFAAETSGRMEDNKGTIVIKETRAGETYKIYKMFDLLSFADDNTAINNHAGDRYSYLLQVNSPWKNFFAAGGAGAAYVTVDMTSGHEVTVDGTDYYQVTGYKLEATGFNEPRTESGKDYETDYTDEDTYYAQSTQAFARAALDYATTNSIGATYTVDGTGNDVTFDDNGAKIPLGYYLLSTTTGTLLSLDTTNMTATVYDKSLNPEDEKKVQEDGSKTADSTALGDGKLGDAKTDYKATNDANIGQRVDYRYVIDVEKGARNYVMHDKMSAGLTFVPSSVKVYLARQDKADAAAAADWQLVNNSAQTTITWETGKATAYDAGKVFYTLNTTNPAASADVSDPTFTIAFDQAFLNDIDTYTTGTTEATKWSLVVLYSATLNENAVIAGDGNTNDAQLTYGNNQKTTKERTTTYTWELDIFKYTGEQAIAANKLDGAQFQMKYGGSVMKFVKVSDGVYKYDDRVQNTTISGPKANHDVILTATVANPDDSTNNVTVVDTITTANGKLVITGLDGDNYVIEETLAPKGYNKLANPIQVKVVSDAEGTAGSVTYDSPAVAASAGQVVLTDSTPYTLASANAAGKFIQVDIQNLTGPELPSTGGIGTTLFYIIGAILVIGAGVVLVSRRRMNA